MGLQPSGFGEERLYQITGHTAHPLFTLFKLLWLRERKPELWKRYTGKSVDDLWTEYAGTLSQ